MSLLKAANSVLDSVHRPTSNDSKSSKQTDSWRPWLISSAIGASVLGLLYSASKLRCKPHDNIPPFAPQDFHYFAGHLPKVASMSHIHEWMYESIKEMGFPSAVSMSIPTQNFVFISYPKLLKYCYDTNFEYCQRADKQCKEYEPLLGKGIFVSNGERWRFHRKVASRMFSMRNLKDFMFTQSRLHVLSTLDKMEQLTLSNTSREIDVNDMLGRFTFDTFCHIAFGVDLKSVDMYPQSHEFGVRFDNLVQEMDYRSRDPLWKLKRVLNVGNEANIKKNSGYIERFVYDILDAKQRGKATSSLKDAADDGQEDLLSLFLKHNPDLSREQLKDVALNFIIAGRDTARMLLTWCLYALSMDKNKNVREQLYAEVDAYSKEPSYGEFISGFRYLEGALCETLRLWPSVPFIGRCAMRDFEIPVERDCGVGNHMIREGDLVLSSCYVSGRNPNIWGEDCLEFKPERWKEKGINTFDQYTFPSFNINPRLCLGKQFAMTEAKVFMFHFLKRFTFERDEKTEIIIKNGVILNINELVLRLRLRDGYFNL